MICRHETRPSRTSGEVGGFYSAVLAHEKVVLSSAVAPLWIRGQKLCTKDRDKPVPGVSRARISSRDE